jgi:hypothetical protein
MKNIKTILILVVAAALVFVMYNVLNKEKSSLSENALSNFAVEDTASVDKIIISDTEAHTMSFKKENKTWVLDDGKCCQQHMIQMFLETFKYVSVKSPVPEGAVDNINKQILLHHKKIEIYQNGKISKTWFIGGGTQDHLGTYMLLKDPELGKSPEPFIMFLPSMYGSLDAQFSTNSLDYVCSDIFTYDPLNIKTINVEVPDNSVLNFKIEAIGENEFKLFNNQAEIPQFDTARVRTYVTFYRKVHFEFLNRTFDQTHIDSLSNSTPYYTIAVTDKNNQTKKVRAYKKAPAFNRYDSNGNVLKYDQDKLWVFTPDNELSVCQYHVFDKLLRDINFFKLKY